MNVHKNARLTARGRYLMVQRVLDEGWTAAAAAEAGGVSERTAYRWLKRYRIGGKAALEDRSSAPGQCRHRLSADRIEAIEALRRDRLTGPQIAARLSLPRSTVGLVLRRLRLGRLRDLEPRPAVVRYERSRPGELVHVDTKKLGRFETVGHRFAGRGPGRHANKGSGFDHVHVCIDDASRLAYSEILPSDGQQDATAFLQKALAWFRRHGVVVERVMTDNGSAYRSKLFAGALNTAGLRHIRTKPYTPRTNGKAERFIQTALREWAYAAPYASSAERANAINPWIEHYNRHRPHAGIQGLSPWQRLNNLLGNDT